MSLGTSRRNFLRAAAAGTAAACVSVNPSRAEAKKLKPPYPIPDEPVTADDYLELWSMADEVLSGNRVTVEAGTFHMPSKDQYVSLFGWDSGWHAIAMSRIDPAVAASEVDVLLSIQEDNGRISHDTKFEEIEEEPGFKTFLSRILGASQYDEMGRSAMIDPPSYIIAAEKIFTITKDRGWLERVLPGLTHCIYYLTHDRDLFGDGLVSVIHPWETGTDSSPAYDELLNLNFNTPLGAPKRGLLYPRLLDYNAEFGWDPEEAKRRNRFILEDMTFNSITIRAMAAVARLHKAAGNNQKAMEVLGQARTMIDAINEINWDESEGCYFSRYDVENPTLARRTTAASIMPMLTGLIDKDRAARLVDEHLKNPDEFWRPYLVPFNAMDELDREKVYMEDLLLWRGHCIWININWMINEGLMAYCYTDLARELTRRTAKMILHEGFREFYDFRNGEGKGATNFNWPGLVLDMIAVTWPEAVEGA